MDHERLNVALILNLGGDIYFRQVSLWLLFDQRLIAQTLSFKEGIATIIRLRMTLYTVEAPSFMEGRMSTFSV